MGIGEAIAESLSREGANVALVSRSEVRRLLVTQCFVTNDADLLQQDKLSAIAERLNGQASGGRCVYRTADVGDYGSIDKAIESIVGEFGSIDILINNVCIQGLFRWTRSVMLIDAGWVSVGRTCCFP